jgi:RNA polymerase sigma-70 factor (ECF subfamily)
VSENDPDADVMLRCAQGDDDAFEEIVRRHQGRVASLAYRYLGSATDAEDVAQDVFLRIYRARESYEPTARFTTWMHRITVNASLNFLRKKRVRRHLNAEMPATGDEGEGRADFADPGAARPHEVLEDAELTEVLRRIIDELPERQRTAILLNKYQGLSYEDTAAALELSLPAVKSLLTRARVNIKEKLLPYLTAGDAGGRTAEDDEA